MDYQNTTEEMEGEKTRGGKWGKFFLFAIGFLLGVSIKAQATRTITMGFNDYKLENLKSDFSFNLPETAEQNSDENVTDESQEITGNSDENENSDEQPEETQENGGNGESANDNN